MIGPLSRGTLPGGGVAPASNQTVAFRVAVIGAVLLALFAVVFFRLWYLQVLSGDSLAAEATRNRVRTIAVTAPRGDIVDRNGRVLVNNEAALVLELEPASLPKHERVAAAEYGQRLGKWFALDSKTRKRTPRPQVAPLTDPALTERYKSLARVLGVTTKEVRRRVVNSIYRLPYANATLRVNADRDLTAYVAERPDVFPGVSTARRFVRSYPEGMLGAQLFGQVGPVPVDEDGNPPERYRRLPLSAFVGLNGLEWQYDQYLRGTDGKIRADIDAFGDQRGALQEERPRSGNELRLTIDLRTQRAAHRELNSARFNPTRSPGAAIAMDPRNGEVLALESAPSFDPSIFTRPLKESTFQSLIDPNGPKPLFNRAISGAYPAASTFKPVTSFAALDTGVTSVGRVIQDNGKIKIADLELQNAGAVALGPVSLIPALRMSSDIYYYTIGAELNGKPRQPLQTWAKRLGYGAKTGIDIPDEISGTVPDRKWREELTEAEEACRKREKKRSCGISDGRPWTLGDNINLAIGQGDIGVTPLQTAVAYAAIANGGTVVRPHLARSSADRRGVTIESFSFKPKRKVEFEQTGLAAVREGLRQAATEPGGTSTQVFANWPTNTHPLYGKTGTAQRDGRPDQSWYAVYVDHPTRPIVVVVTTETGGFGAESAAPIAAEILKAWYRLGSDVEVAAGDSATR